MNERANSDVLALRSFETHSEISRSTCLTQSDVILLGVCFYIDFATLLYLNNSGIIRELLERERCNRGTICLSH